MKPAARDIMVIFAKAFRSYSGGLAVSMVMLRDLAQLYLLHVNVESGASLGFGRGTQSHYGAENLLNGTIQVNHVPSL